MWLRLQGIDKWSLALLERCSVFRNIKTMNFIKRDSKGRFVSTKTKVKFATFLIFTVGTLTAGHLYVEPAIDRANEETRKVLENVQKELHYVAPKAEAAEITPSKIEEMKADVLNRLEKCENPSKKPIVFDSNGVASVGQFQWQPHSFQHYWEKMTGEKITEKEAVIKALDDATARRLASYVIFETDKGSAKDWVNCTKWHDLGTLVEFIKAHE